jgi:murein L,D-transpeptidase YcbB/YkuD
VIQALLVIAATVAPFAQRPLPALSPDERVAERIRGRVEATAGQPLYEGAALGGFYTRRSFRPAWSNEHGPNRLADDLIDALDRADLEGLRPADYHVAEIRTLLTAVRADAADGRHTNPDRLAELDLLLTDAFLLYGSHLLAGRVDPETLHPRWEANRRGADLATVLDDALESRNVARALQRLAPTQDGYRWLREALGRVRAVAASGGWPALPDGAVLKRGDQAPAVALLRERLRLEGDLPSAPKSQDVESFDDSLEQALERFQQRHGLEVDGAVTPTTRAELNVSAADRAEQLRLNLERWRWLPQDLGRRRILVNIAAYQLQVIEDEEVVLSMRVVVGMQYKRTPVFSDTMRYIVLNPNWHVPRSIAVEELIPKVQSDPSYLERFGMRLLTAGPDPQEVDPGTVDWASVRTDSFPYRFRQEPGRLNALGRIKFMFPNPYDVYLHDTPSRGLFDRAQRDFSHGCIRIEKPIDLAVYLMRKNGRWNREAIEAALDEGTERTIYLPKPMPIHLLYWTAWADADGTIQFRSDIHGLDQPLAEALDAPLRH